MSQGADDIIHADRCITSWQMAVQLSFINGNATDSAWQCPSSHKSLNPRGNCPIWLDCSTIPPIVLIWRHQIFIFLGCGRVHCVGQGLKMRTWFVQWGHGYVNRKWAGTGKALHALVSRWRSRRLRWRLCGKRTRVKETSSYTRHEFHTVWVYSFREKKCGALFSEQPS
jgi:hypothetical protein